MPLSVGTQAPTFELPDQERNPVSLDDFKGHKSLIVFIPFPFSNICQSELCTIRDRLAALNDVEANVAVITVNNHFTNKKWSDENGFQFPVLADFWPHGDTARAYDAFNEQIGAANRVTYVLDADGVIREVVDSGSLGTAREFDDYVEALDAFA